MLHGTQGGNRRLPAGQPASSLTHPRRCCQPAQCHAKPRRYMQTYEAAQRLRILKAAPAGPPWNIAAMSCAYSPVHPDTLTPLLSPHSPMLRSRFRRRQTDQSRTTEEMELAKVFLDLSHILIWTQSSCCVGRAYKLPSPSPPRCSPACGSQCALLRAQRLRQVRRAMCSCCSGTHECCACQVRAEVEEAARLREQNKRGVKRALQVHPPCPTRV